ncbi:MAG: PAS domain S-box protein [Anaerolineaceae bacterium]|jgi:PAS domain S-box-containing protein
MKKASKVSTQRKVEAALAHTEAFLEVLFEKAGIGILLIDAQERLLRSNPAFQQMVGRTEQELEQMRYSSLHHPFDQAAGQQLFNDLITGRRELFTVEQRYLRSSGEVVWAHVIASRLASQDEETKFVIAMLEDVTEQKQIEQELEEMRRRLMLSRENERLRLAQELHDSPLQEIIGLSFQVQNLLVSQGEIDTLQELRKMQTTLELIARKMRALASDLRPPTLAPFGLCIALQSHSENVQRSHPNFNINLQLDRDDQSLPEETRLALFRIYQESLNNIIRHSKADQVWIRLALDAEQVILEIQDNGQGVNLPARWISLARDGHFGLVGARERAEALGGRFEVCSSPGGGTLIRVVVPRQVIEEGNLRSGSL